MLTPEEKEKFIRDLLTEPFMNLKPVKQEDLGGITPSDKDNRREIRKSRKELEIEMIENLPKDERAIAAKESGYPLYEFSYETQNLIHEQEEEENRETIADIIEDNIADRWFSDLLF